MATPTKEHTEIGEIETVTIDELRIDPAYQREPSMDLVQRIARDWSAKVAGPIVVSRRSNGDLFVVNGQHRMLAAKMAGLETIQAQVLEGLDRKQEAEHRLHGNVGLGERALERYHAELAAEYVRATSIQEILGKFDTKVNRSPQMSSGINAVAAIEWVWERDHGVLLTRELELIQSAWGKPEGPAMLASMTRGLAWFMLQHQGGYDRNRLVERMSAESPQAVLRMARTHRGSLGGSIWLNVYRALVELYNYRLNEANRLEWKIRGYGKHAGGSSGIPHASGGDDH